MNDSIEPWRRDKKMVKEFHRQCLSYGDKFIGAEINKPMVNSFLHRVFRNRHFLVQVYSHAHPEHQHAHRLSVNRCKIDVRSGDWIGDITWDELMACKRGCGYVDDWCIEIYPPDKHIVNVSSIRHLWVLDSPPSQAWIKP